MTTTPLCLPLFFVSHLLTLSIFQIFFAAQFFFRLPAMCPDIYIDDAENTTSKSHDPRTLLMAPAQQEETIFVEGIGMVPAKCSPKIKSELFSLL